MGITSCTSRFNFILDFSSYFKFKFDFCNLYFSS